LDEEVRSTAAPSGVVRLGAPLWWGAWEKEQNSMKAIVQDEYGLPDALVLKDIDKPVVKDDEVLVRVHAASVHPDVWHVLRGLPRGLKLVVMSPFVSQLPALNFSMPSKKDSMTVLKELLEAGKITPVIDRTYPLSEVPEAIRYLEEGHALGKVLIRV
jgi:NADPH:quinone reductase-like Zn-dependent oxidoreductase